MHNLGQWTQSFWVPLGVGPLDERKDGKKCRVTQNHKPFLFRLVTSSWKNSIANGRWFLYPPSSTYLSCWFFEWVSPHFVFTSHCFFCPETKVCFTFCRALNSVTQKWRFFYLSPTVARTPQLETGATTKATTWQPKHEKRRNWNLKRQNSQSRSFGHWLYSVMPRRSSSSLPSSIVSSFLSIFPSHPTNQLCWSHKNPQAQVNDRVREGSACWIWKFVPT